MSKKLMPLAAVAAMTAMLPGSALYVRADATNPTVILAELQRTFEAFKETHTEQIKGMQAKFDDVVTREKLDKVNADVGALQKALEDAVTKMAASQIGGGKGADRVKDAEYSQAFAQHFRRGDVQASLNKGTAPEGGFLAPTEWDRTITDKLVVLSPVRGLARVQLTSTGSYSKLFNLRGTGSGWVGETAARPETTTPTFGSMSFSVGEMYANPFASQAMLDDALIDIETWLANEVYTEFAYQEGVAFISGSGANGRPNGLLTYVTGGANAAANPLGAIGLVNTGSAAALTADGIINLIHALPSAFTQRAVHLMNRNTMGLVRLLKDTTNQYLWQPSYAAGQPQTLSGYPIVEVAAMPNVAAGAKAIAFGDVEQTYTIIDHSVGTRILRDPFSAKPYVTFYTTKRVGGAVVNPEAMKVQNTSV